MPHELTVLIYISVGLLGLCLGSFATALIYRIPRGISWIWNNKDAENPSCRSACPDCGHKLGPLDLIPLFSWIFSRGKCRYCAAPVSRLYPLTELSCMVLALALYAVWGAQPATIAVLLVVPVLVAHIVIDWRHMILPDDLNIAAFALSALFLILGGAGDQWPYHLAAGIIYPLLFWGMAALLKRWKGQDMLGMGDLKFLPSAGLFLGLSSLSSFMIVGGALGIAIAAFYAAKGQKGAFPFGPALVISLLFHLFLTGYGFEYTW